MKMKHRSSVLGLLDTACPRAIDHHVDGVPWDRRVVGQGIAAHACLQAVGDALREREANPIPSEWVEFVERIIRSMAAKLTARGRSFDGGDPEVLTPAQAFGGRDLARDWLVTHELSHRARYETAMAVDRGMRAVPYARADARLIGVLDMVIDEDCTDEDGSGGWVRRAVDWKTSWHAGAEWLTSTQAKCQAVLLWADLEQDRLRASHGYGNAVSGVVVSVANMR
ncbi:MAG: hypothetical protein GY733_07060, partial [bacterium]|nr:hypothetical protein [bacterium]